jgi:hypothetical protein
MTKQRIGGLCIIFVFCFAFVIASPAQSTFFTPLYRFCASGLSW